MPPEKQEELTPAKQPLGSTWYRTRWNKIEPVTVQKFTSGSVWIDGRRNARVIEWQGHFQTWEEAHAHLLSQANLDVLQARNALQRAQDVLGNIRGMKRP